MMENTEETLIERPTKMDESVKQGFSIFSWNINGIRTINMTEVLQQFNADLVAVQETKIARDQLDRNTAFIGDYSSYFTFSRKKSGYSGVATYASKEFVPEKAEEGLTNLLQIQMNKTISDSVGNYVNLDEAEKVLAKGSDAEGRCVITQHVVQEPSGGCVPLTVINVYCPRLRDDPEDNVDNTDSKYLFHKLIEKRARQFAQSGSFVLIVGDFNISHTFLDHAEGVDSVEFKKSIFRQWMDDLFKNDNQIYFQDTFRFLHPARSGAFSCWNSKTNARQNNYGSRIDYIVADNKLMTYLQSAEIHQDIVGSDHCPISAIFHSLLPIASCRLPTFATKYYPELCGTQKKIQHFFLKQPKGLPSTNTTSQKTVKVKQSSISTYLIKKPKLESSSTIKSHVMTNLPELSESETKFELEENIKEADRSDCGTTKLNLVVPKQISKPSQGLNPNDGLTQKGVQSLCQSEIKSAWKTLMKQKETPLCSGHNAPCILKTVRKKGTSQGRQFWTCARGTGLRSDPNANCNFFLWCSSSSNSVIKSNNQ